MRVVTDDEIFVLSQFEESVTIRRASLILREAGNNILQIPHIS